MLTRYPAQGATSRSVWIDLFNPTPEEIAAIKSDHNLRVPSRDQLEEIESSSRLSRDGDTLYLNMSVATMDVDGAMEPTPLGFVLTSQMLVTVHFARLHTFETVAANLKEKSGTPTSTGVFASLIEGIVDFSADQLEGIAADLTGISKRVFRRTDPKARHIKRMNRLLRDMLASIGFAGEHSSQIRESLLGLQRIASYTLETCKTWPEKDFLERLNTARHDLQSLVDYEAHLSAKSQFLLDAILGFINTEQNDIFKVLTIVSVVGIPPTLIASMYGMNFRYMPELNWPWGYGYALGLIALSIIVPVGWFKWRGWW